jgi:transcriptional regulator with XRE-family HTH domain
MKRASVTFKFPAELAARLREVRLGAGLSQSQLAMLMGRTGKGAWTVVARLEKGRATYPSVGLLSDFLRGCRADFDAISDLLNEYCRQPVLPEQLALAQVTRMVAELPDKVAAEVTKYDLKTSLALRDKGRLARPDYSAMPLGKLTALRQEPAGQRLERVRKMANRVVVRRWLEQEMDRALDVYAHELQWGARLWMKSYGIKVFWIMKRTQTKPQAWRERQLERAWKRNFHSSGLSIPALRAMEQLAIELYEEVRALGVIDKLDKARPGEVEGMRPEPDCDCPDQGD